jgi:hypothetical protein
MFAVHKKYAFIQMIAHLHFAATSISHYKQGDSLRTSSC